MIVALILLTIIVSVVRVTGRTERRERNYPTQKSQTEGIDQEIDSLRDKLYSKGSGGRMGAREEILSWIHLASILQVKDTVQNTGGGILQGEAVEALTEALSIIDRLARDSSMEDQKRKELFSSKFHAHHIRGVLHRSMGNPALAVGDHDVCLSLGGNKEAQALAHYTKGNALMNIKKGSSYSLADAIISLEAALALEPDYLQVYPTLVEAHKAHKKNSSRQWKALVARMEAVAATLDSQGVDTDAKKKVSHIYFALYEAAEAANDLDKAFTYLDKARAIEFASRGKAAYTEQMETTHLQLRSIFSQSFFADPLLQYDSGGSGVRGEKEHDEGPVFIIGMMRSGSTLLETLLDLHPSIQGIGEYSVFNANLNSFRHDLVTALAKAETAVGVMGPRKVLRAYARDVWSSMRESAARLHRPHDSGDSDNDDENKEDYNSVQGTSPAHILDKMLFNYKNVGFIHLVYPRAFILHLIRDPMDNLFSAYRKKFDDDGMEWTLSSQQLVSTYVQYLHLMQHFRRELPGRVIDIPFEVLVNHPEAVLRHVVKTLGVPWDNRILDLQSSSRVILTHSRMQMGEGIHNLSVGAWTRYASQLRPLALELHGHLPRLRKEKALPFVSHYNWALDADFDYAACVQAMARDLGYLQGGDTGHTQQQQQQAHGEDNGNGLDGDKEEINSTAFSSSAAPLEYCREEAPVFEWDQVEGSAASRHSSQAEREKEKKVSIPLVFTEDEDSRRRGGGDGEALEQDSSQEGESLPPSLSSSSPQPLSSQKGLLRNKLQLCPGAVEPLLSALAASSLLKSQKGQAQQLLKMPAEQAILSCHAAALKELVVSEGASRPSKSKSERSFTVLKLIIDSSSTGSINRVGDGDHGCRGQGQMPRVTVNLTLTDLIRAGATAAAFAGEYAAAVSLLETLINDDGEDVDALDRLAEVQTVLGHPEAALQAVSDALEVELNDQKPVGHRVLRACQALISMGSIELAYNRLMDLKRSTDANDAQFALHSAHDRALLLKALAKCEHEFGNLESAIILYSEMITVTETPPHSEDRLLMSMKAESLYERSISLMTYGRHVEAEADLDSAISMGLEAKVVYGFRALLKQNLGRSTDAQRDLTQVLGRYDATDSTALLVSAACFENVGDYPRAIDRYNEMQSLNPSSIAEDRREVAIYRVLQMEYLGDSGSNEDNMGNQKHEQLPPLPAEIKMRLAYGKENPSENRGNASAPANNEYPSAIAMRRGLLTLDFHVVSPLPGAGLSAMVGGADADLDKAEALLSVLNKTWHIPAFVQSKEPGFIPHRVHHRQFQLAVPHMAQALLQAASASVTTLSRAHWRNFFEIGRAWRAASESMDAVFWVDELGLPDNLQERIGMNTYLQLGRNKVARYYPQVHKAIHTTKKWLLRKGYYDEDLILIPVPAGSVMARRIESADSLYALFDAIGRNFLIVTDIATTDDEGRAGGMIDGVIFALIKSKSGPGWDFSVNAYLISSRFADFSTQMEVSFRRTMQVVSAARASMQLHTSSTSPSSREQVAVGVLEAALELFYYWANFGALTRGTSAVGHVTIAAIAMAAGFDVAKNLPAGVQLDWEAFYATSPRDFIDAVGSYLSLHPSRHALEELPSIEGLVSRPLDMQRALLGGSPPPTFTSPSSSRSRTSSER